MEWDVYLETRPGSGFEYHLENELDVLGSRPWDVVVMHGHSALDLHNHGDPVNFLETARELSGFLHGVNPEGDIYLTASWSRADLTYPEGTAWHGLPIDAMALDVRAAYDQAASTGPGVRRVNPIGEAWARAPAGDSAFLPPTV